MKNRRAHSRVPVDDGALRVTMAGRRGSVDGRVTDASAGGLQVAFPRRPQPVAALATEVFLELIGAPLREAVGVRARVCHRDETDDGVTYGFQLLEPASIEALIPQDLLPVFNRRVESRRVPEEPLEIPIQLSTYGTDGHHTAAASMVDLSTVGVAVVVDASTEWMFATTRYLTASIQLVSPNRSPAITIECQIRNRKLIDKGIRYGMAFVEKRTDQFAMKQRKIVDYLEPWNGDFG